MCGGGGDKKGMGQAMQEAAAQVSKVSQPAPAQAPEDPKKKVRGYATRGNILTSGSGLTQKEPNTKKNLLGG